MPTSTPVERRSVLPNALAFENTNNGSGGGASVSYQQRVTTTVNVINNITQIEQKADNQALLRADTNAERRAKQFTNSHGETWLWDIGSPITLDFPISGAIPFSHRVIQSPGNSYTNANGFRHKTFKGSQGTWLVGAYMQINFPLGQGVLTCNLEVWKNGNIYKVIDACDVDMTGDGAAMRDCLLRGTVPIILDCGDFVDFHLRTTQTAGSGSTVFAYPTSVQGYAWGALQRHCQSTNDSPISGLNYIFV